MPHDTPAMTQALAEIAAMPSRRKPAMRMSLHQINTLIAAYQMERGDAVLETRGGAKWRLREHFRAAGIEIDFDMNRRCEYAPEQGEEERAA